MLVERVCGTRIETLAMIQRDIIARDCTQEPEVRSETATSSQSLISYGNATSRPAPAVLPNAESESGSPALATLVHLLPVLLQ